MGAAKTLGFEEIGELARLGKEIGYKGSQIEGVPKLLVIHGLLSQLLAALEKLLKNIKKDREAGSFIYQELIDKLKKASLQMGDLRASVKG